VQEIEAQVNEQVLSMAGGDIINLFLDLLDSFLNGITGVNLIKLIYQISASTKPPKEGSHVHGCS